MNRQPLPEDSWDRMGTREPLGRTLRFLGTSLTGMLAVIVFFTVIHLAERDVDDTSRMAAANAQMDQMQKRLDKAAADLCRSELGPGAQVLWTVEGDLVCRPAVLTAEAAR